MIIKLERTRYKLIKVHYILFLEDEKQTIYKQLKYE